MGEVGSKQEAGHFVKGPPNAGFLLKRKGVCSDEGAEARKERVSAREQCGLLCEKQTSTVRKNPTKKLDRVSREGK